MLKIEYYGCMVDIFGRGGFVGEVKKFIESMLMKLNIVIWGSFLNVCKIYGYLEIEEDVVSYFYELVLEDGGVYVLLFNIFVVKSDWDSVGNVRKMIREIIFDKKIFGCSLIEVNSEVYEFFVEDRLYFLWGEINDVIMGLKNYIEIEDYV